ncbi:C39 family peptidase [Paenibacillus tengchongensis]|uniref:C39 family peptidase n=1 Tax=Paenibacillus tengchongensis TaxID=2608684 RepID=UPI00124D7C75|nr:C39 family peptidase [Paenibacillus tengchongensis]
MSGVKGPLQRRVLSAEAYTQWEPEVESPGSACGPATMAALMEYWHTRKGRTFIPGAGHFASKAAHINYIYRYHGGAPWGMSARGFARGAKAYIRSAAAGRVDMRRLVSVALFNDVDRYKAEIDCARPVALKFDKWSAFRWRGDYVFDYHWVLGVGYEETAQGTVFVVHDNGARRRGGGFVPGQERRTLYTPNREIITMVSLDIGAPSRP